MAETWKRTTLAVVLFGVLGFSFFAAPVAAVGLEAVADPRPLGFLTDTTGTLSEVDRARLDETARRATSAGTGDLGVAVVDSTDGAEPRAFATGLYNRWHLGAGRGDVGVLLFVALSDRAVEIVLGDGLDSPATRRVAQEIVDHELVPRFRAGAPAAAVVAGAEAIARQLLGAPAAGPAEAESAGGSVAESPPTASGLGTAPLSPVSEPTPIRAPAPAPLPAPEPLRRRSAELPLATTLAVLGAFALAVLLWQRRRRHCRQCGTPWQLLSEEAESAHLPATAETEERIGSVDYDVLQCPTCHRLEFRRCNHWFTGFDYCPRCRGKTLRTEATVLVAPTTRSTGRQRVVLDCEHCEFRDERTVVLPREEEVSYSSTGRGSSASSYSVSSSSSSSNSSSGGGHSSGGGASGRW